MLSSEKLPEIFCTRNNNDIEKHIERINDVLFYYSLDTFKNVCDYLADYTYIETCELVGYEYALDLKNALDNWFAEYGIYFDEFYIRKYRIIPGTLDCLFKLELKK